MCQAQSLEKANVNVIASLAEKSTSIVEVYLGFPVFYIIYNAIFQRRIELIFHWFLKICHSFHRKKNNIIIMGE